LVVVLRPLTNTARLARRGSRFGAWSGSASGLRGWCPDAAGGATDKSTGGARTVSNPRRRPRHTAVPRTPGSHGAEPPT